eukprot:SAG31_NODE_138_length_22877_cov_29.540917_2_plen_130_part_00
METGIRTWLGVVALVLPPDDDRASRVALHNARVDPGSHAVGVRVEALAVSLAGRAVLAGHPGCVGVVGDSNAVVAVVASVRSQRLALLVGGRHRPAQGAGGLAKQQCSGGGAAVEAVAGAAVAVAVVAQ